MPTQGPPLGARPLSLQRARGAGIEDGGGGGAGAAAEDGAPRGGGSGSGSASARAPPQAEFARSRHFGVRAEWSQSLTPRVCAAANYPRFVGAHKLSPLSNNSERMRLSLQPDPWSASTAKEQQRVKEEGVGHLFATHTSMGHSSTLVWPGMLQGHSRAGTAPHRETATSVEESNVLATPRGLTKRDITCLAARDWAKRMPIPESERHRYGRGMLRVADVDEEQMPRRQECRGKYTG